MKFVMEDEKSREAQKKNWRGFCGRIIGEVENKEQEESEEREEESMK